MANSADFDVYLSKLIALGHGRDWVRRYESVLRVRFERDPLPFPLPPKPHTAPRERYDELG